MNILVTGGAGFIGGNLVRELTLAGHFVRVADNYSRGRDYFRDVTEGSPPEVFPADLRSFQACIDVVGVVDVVFHLASRVGGIGVYRSDPFGVLSDNMIVDSNIIRACIATNKPKFVYASTAHVYPITLQDCLESPPLREEDAYPADPMLTYGWSKLIGEKLLESSDLVHASARILGAYGPGQDFDLDTGSVIPVFCKRAIDYPDTEFKVKSPGYEYRSYCYVNDVVGCLIKMMDYLNDENESLPPMNVGAHEKISVGEIANKVVKLSKKQINISYDNTDPEIKCQWCSVDKVKDVLGWEATTVFDEGLSEVFKDVQKRSEKVPAN